MSYGPFSPAHVVTAAEWNEFVQALSDEVTRATAAETLLDGRTDTLETFKTTTEGIFPVSSTGLIRYVGADALVVNNISVGTDIGLIGRCSGAGGGTAFILDLSRAVEPGMKVKQLNIYVTGQHFGTLPTALHFALTSYDMSAGTTTDEDTWTDNPADVAALNSRRSTGHTLGSPVTVSSSKQYFLRVYNHAGGTDSGGTREITYHGALVVVSA